MRRGIDADGAPKAHRPARHLAGNAGADGHPALPPVLADSSRQPPRSGRRDHREAAPLHRQLALLEDVAKGRRVVRDELGGRAARKRPPGGVTAAAGVQALRAAPVRDQRRRQGQHCTPAHQNGRQLAVHRVRGCAAAAGVHPQGAHRDCAGAHGVHGPVQDAAGRGAPAEERDDRDERVRPTPSAAA